MRSETRLTAEKARSYSLSYYRSLLFVFGLIKLNMYNLHLQKYKNHRMEYNDAGNLSLLVKLSWCGIFYDFA